jgi:RecA-family ATPase
LLPALNTKEKEKNDILTSNVYQNNSQWNNIRKPTQTYELTQQIETVVQRIEKSQTDITTSYVDWLNLGFAFTPFGDLGREYYHRISSFYDNYDSAQADLQFDKCMTANQPETPVTVSTFFDLAKKGGIDISKPKKSDCFEGTIDFITDKSQRYKSYMISATELMNRPIEQLPTLVEPIIHKTGLAMISGDSEAGKSAFLRNLCMAVVSGEETFLDFKLNAEHKRAIYVSSEDADDATTILLKRQNKDFNKNTEFYKGLDYLFHTPHLLEDLDYALNDKPADLVIIDTFSDMFTGNINQSNEVRNWLQKFFELAQNHKCLFFFLHHDGKSKKEDIPSKNSALGSRAIEAKMRLVFHLKKDKHTKGLSHLTITKGNYLPDDFKDKSFDLTFTENMTYENTGEMTLLEDLDKNKTEDIKNAQRKLFETVLTMPLTHTELCNKMIQLKYVKSDSTAKRRISEAYKDNIISKDKDGKYEYLPF